MVAVSLILLSKDERNSSTRKSSISLESISSLFVEEVYILFHLESYLESDRG